MRTLWKLIKGTFMITGAYAWIAAIADEVISLKREPEPIVQPVMFQNHK